MTASICSARGARLGPSLRAGTMMLTCGASLTVTRDVTVARMLRHATVHLALAALTLVTGGCGQSQPPRERVAVVAGPLRLTVVTYNIHHGEGTDKKLDLPRIAEVIRRCEPDFVALQEVDNGTRRTN